MTHVGLLAYKQCNSREIKKSSYLVSLANKSFRYAELLNANSFNLRISQKTAALVPAPYPNRSTAAIVVVSKFYFPFSFQFFTRLAAVFAEEVCHYKTNAAGVLWGATGCGLVLV